MSISTYTLILTPSAATRSHIVINGFETSSDATAFGTGAVADAPTAIASYLVLPGPTVAVNGGAFDIRPGGGAGGGAFSGGGGDAR